MKYDQIILSCLALFGVAVLADEPTFTRTTWIPLVQVSGVGAAWGDFDGDGRIDVFVGATTNNPNQNSPNKLFRNLGNGAFTVVVSPALPADIGVITAGWPDVDNDGSLDLYGSKLGGDLLYRNNRDGTFSRTINPITSESAAGVGSAWADFDNDGFVDLFVANEGSPNALFRNDGKGGFIKVNDPLFNLNVASQAAAWADYDNDGRQDLVVVNYQNHQNLLYHNEGAGKFTRVGAGPVATEIGGFGACAWGDYDNDGNFDLALGSYGPRNILYRNNGGGSFTKITTSAIVADPIHCSSVVWGDYDNDGWLDFMASGSGNGYQHVYLYHNNGDGSFRRVTTGQVVTDTGEGRTCAFVDYDGDGFLDIFVARSFGYLNGLYHNSGNTNHWLQLKCEGRISNRAAIGAKLRLTATLNGAEVRQLRQITATETIAHFGLADATNVTTLRIEWPSGITQEFHNVPADKLMTLREPSRVAISSNSSVELRGASGCVYAIEKSSDLITWNPWLSVTNTSSVAATALIETNNASIFFRAIEQP